MDNGLTQEQPGEVVTHLASTPVGRMPFRATGGEEYLEKRPH
jgi:hypothetical protein